MEYFEIFICLIGVIKAQGPTSKAFLTSVAFLYASPSSVFGPLQPTPIGQSLRQLWQHFHRNPFPSFTAFLDAHR
jgi:hypothetical protein